MILRWNNTDVFLKCLIFSPNTESKVPDISKWSSALKVGFGFRFVAGGFTGIRIWRDAVKTHLVRPEGQKDREIFCECVFMWMVPAYRREKKCMLRVNVCVCCIYVRLCVGVWTETLKKINYGKADGWEEEKKITRSRLHTLTFCPLRWWWDVSSPSVPHQISAAWKRGERKTGEKLLALPTHVLNHKFNQDHPA